MLAMLAAFQSIPLNAAVLSSQMLETISWIHTTTWQSFLPLTVRWWCKSQDIYFCLWHFLRRPFNTQTVSSAHIQVVKGGKKKKKEKNLLRAHFQLMFYFKWVCGCCNSCRLCKAEVSLDLVCDMILLILPLLPELSMSQCCLREIPSQLAAFPVSITLTTPFLTDSNFCVIKEKGLALNTHQKAPFL